MDMTPYQDPLPTELEQIMDEARADAGLGPAKRPAGQGIKDMQARIKYYTDLLKKFLDQDPTPENLAYLDECKRQLKAANDRLAEYRLQSKGLN